MASSDSDAITQQTASKVHGPVTSLHVALSGPDNVGKTTQLRILGRRLGPRAQFAGPLDAFDPRWQRIKLDGMAAWWFETASMAELADVLACSCLERAHQRLDAPVCLVDRGLPMLEASLAATAAVREALDPTSAAERARRLLSPFAADLDSAEGDEHAVTLLHHRDPEIGANRSLARETSATDIYRAYQRQLHLQFQRLVEAGRFRQVIVTEQHSIVAVQAQVRRSLNALGISVPRCRLTDVHVTALGGLSESGKSTAAEYLRLHHGHARLKLGYLIEEAAERCGIADPYAADPVTRAELIVDGLDRYCTAHHFAEHLSIESLHDHAGTLHLRTLLGEKLTVIYLDAPQELRAERNIHGPEDLIERDAVKCSRGAERIATIADRVIDNRSGLFTLTRQLDPGPHPSATWDCRCVWSRIWRRCSTMRPKANR
jgi:cytidylate kinase